MKLKINRVLHAGYLFEYENTKILFDPIFENPFSHNCYAFPNVKFNYDKIKHLNFSAIIISHYHDDHCSFESLKFINKSTPIYIYCLDIELIELIKKIGFQYVYQIQLNKPFKINSFEIKAFEAIDIAVDTLFSIKVNNLKILNVVDALISDQALELLELESPWDMVLWPFQILRETDVLSPNRNQTRFKETPSEFIDQMKSLKPKTIVPSSCQFIHESWSWYNEALFSLSYEQFSIDIRNNLHHCEVFRLDPGQGVYIDNQSLKPCENLSWVTILDLNKVDYQFNSDHVAPPTSEIAVHLESVTELISKTVTHFCNVDLVNQFNQLNESNESYFNKQVIWKLVLYNHLGQSIEYFYLINNNKMSHIDNFSGDIGWLTELPLVKLHNAIKNGETLTSMYIRINDTKFNNKIEEQINEVDILEDPLVRVLFNKSPFSYQINQYNLISN